MYATIRRYTVKDPSKANAAITDFKSRIETKFFPMLNELPGLHAYHVLNTNNSELVTISIFETRDGADHSTLRAAEFVADRSDQRPALRAGNHRGRGDS